MSDSTSTSSREWPGKGAWILGGLLGLAALGTLYLFAPESVSWYPQCQFRQWTGWQCPFCGGLRAGHLALHGHWREAWLLNPFLFLSVPWLGGPWLRARWSGHPVKWNTLSFKFWCAAAILFWVGRNLV